MWAIMCKGAFCIAYSPLVELKCPPLLSALKCTVPKPMSCSRRSASYFIMCATMPNVLHLLLHNLCKNAEQKQVSLNENASNMK